MSEDANTLLARYADDHVRDRLTALWTVAQFFRQSILADDYNPSPRYAKALALSDSGQKIADRLNEKYPKASEASVRLALFGQFAVQEPLISSESAIPLLEATFAEEVRHGAVRFPWIFGRKMHDEYHLATHGVHVEPDYELTQTLMSRTPPGVFQLGHRVVGPLGLLSSLEWRSIPPSRHIPLWHCNDPGCPSIHQGHLTTGKPLLNAILESLYVLLVEDDAEAGDWDGFFDKLSPIDVYDDRTTLQLPFLLANGFADIERRHLLGELLSHAELRETLSGIPGNSRLAQRSPEDILSQLDEPSVLQLILTASDRWIVAQLDQCVRVRHISIPTPEIRTVAFVPRDRMKFHMRTECSSLGVRAVSMNTNHHLLRLRALVLSLEGLEDFGDLKWHLTRMGYAGADTSASLEQALLMSEPRSVVKDLVMLSPTALRRALEFVRAPDLPIPSTPGDVEALVEIMLWKLGFDLQRYPEMVPRVRRLLATLLSVSDQDTASDRGMETVRSAAVNAFVALEEVLTATLALTTWAMWSDHAAVTRFEFEPDAAQEFAADLLERRALITGEDGERVSLRGRLTLQPLAVGISEVARLLEQDLAAADQYERPHSAFPASAKSELHLYPFVHTIALADLAPGALATIVVRLRDAVIKLERSGAIGVRNRLTHHRPDFPTTTELQMACQGVNEALVILFEAGLVPHVRWRERVDIDRYGRRVAVLRDLDDHDLTVLAPSALDPWPWPATKGPIIIIDEARLPGTSMSLRFDYKPRSDFVDMWRGYPARMAEPKPEETSGDAAPATGIAPHPSEDALAQT